MLFIIESQRKRYLKYKNGKKNSKLPKHIYFTNNNRYVITKWIDGKHTYFKSFGTLTEAVEYRDRLIANDWKPLDLTDEEILEDNVQKYYRGIYLSTNHRQYIVNNKQKGYLGLCKTIEEALQFIGENDKDNEVDIEADKVVEFKGSDGSVQSTLI